MGKPLQTMLYTGPALQSILARQYPDADEHKLAVLEVPGLPEVIYPLCSKGSLIIRDWQGFPAFLGSLAVLAGVGIILCVGQSNRGRSGPTPSYRTLLTVLQQLCLQACVPLMVTAHCAFYWRWAH